MVSSEVIAVRAAASLIALFLASCSATIRAKSSAWAAFSITTTYLAFLIIDPAFAISLDCIEDPCFVGCMIFGWLLMMMKNGFLFLEQEQQEQQQQQQQQQQQHKSENLKKGTKT